MTRNRANRAERRRTRHQTTPVSLARVQARKPMAAPALRVPVPYDRAMGLAEQVHETIAQAREKGAKPNPSFTADQDNIAALTDWLNGIQDALALVAAEVEKLAAQRKNA